jgi:hypothetical protein
MIRMKRFLLFCMMVGCLILTSNRSPSAELYINEILAHPSQEDEYGTPLEWIELYNSGPQSVNLLDYYLSDNPEIPRKWQIGPAEIPANGYFLIWTTGYDLYDPGKLQSNFRLDNDGESLVLTHAAGDLIDAVTFPTQMEDVSYGRRVDASPAWGFFTTPTPAKANTTPWIEGFLPPPTFSTPGQVFSRSVTITLSCDEPDAYIRYTTDSSEPSNRSRLYTEPLRFTDTTIIRAQVFKTGFSPSRIETHSYIKKPSMTLPVLSLVTEAKNLFDRSTGIYQNATQHGPAWERPVSVELFTPDTKQAFAVDCGIRIHGGASRSRSPKKSFRLYFRSEYGAKKLHYPLFPDTAVTKFDNLVLRAGFNDSWGYDRDMQRVTAILASDQVCRNLHRDMGQVVAHGMWVELYLNGEWWGIYNPTERLEEDFMESYFNTRPWNLVSDNEVSEGDPRSWNQFIAYMQSGNFANPDAFNELSTRLDIENFTTYIIMNVWIMNYDWPRHNWVASQAQTEEGKWRLFMWDAEYSFGSGINGYMVSQNTMDNARSDTIGTIFNGLIKNSQYRDYFWRMLQYQLQTTLSKEHVLHRLHEQVDIIRPVIPLEAEKWGRGMDIDDWEHAVQLARDFVDRRTPYVLDHVERVLGPPPVSVSEWSLY